MEPRRCGYVLNVDTSMWPGRYCSEGPRSISSDRYEIVIGNFYFIARKEPLRFFCLQCCRRRVFPRGFCQKNRFVLLLYLLLLRPSDQRIDLTGSVRFQDGATPLFKAAHKGHAAVVSELLKYKPNLGLLPVSLNRSASTTSHHHPSVARSIYR